MATERFSYNNAEGRPGVELVVLKKHKDGTLDLGDPETGELRIGKCTIGEGEGQCRVISADAPAPTKDKK